MKIGKMKKISVISIICAMFFSLINFNTSKMINAQTQNNNDGLILNKTAVYAGENTYQITLESYITGEFETDLKTVPTDFVLVLDQSTSMKNYMAGRNSRLKVLKKTANKFANEIFKNAKENNVDHRMSIIGFADGKEGWSSNYNNSELLSVPKETFWGVTNNEINYENAKEKHYADSLISVNSNGKLNNVINDAIDDLDADGNTYPNVGLDMANKVLNYSGSYADVNRNKVVILLTDGYPAPSGTDVFNDYIANSAISNAKEIKNNAETKLYTIGINNECNPDSDFEGNSQEEKMNRYMHYSSSNYPNATSLSYGGERDEIGNYYFSANDENALSNVFEQIKQETGRPSMELDGNTALIDVMSNYFDVPEDITDINLYTADYIGANTWGSRTPYEGTVEYHYNEKGEKDGIIVTGFNYKEHYVAYNDESYRGKKLIVEFETKVKDGFIGGLSVDTNDSSSGIYENKNSGELIKEFNQPKVDVDLNYDFNTYDRAIYVRNQWNEVEKFIKNYDDKIEYTINGEKYNLNDYSYANDYVDIIYTVYDGTTEIGQYKISAGSDNGEWTYINIDTSNYVSKHEFKIAVDVKNSDGISASNTDDHEQKSNIVKDKKNSKLYLYIPTFESRDDEIFSGETVKLNDYVKLKEWIPQDKDIPDVVKDNGPEGEKPNITYKIFNNEKQITSYTGGESGIFKFDYEVEANGKSVKDLSKYNHIDSFEQCDSKPCVINHFYIKVSGGTISISKEISNEDLQKYDFEDGDPIFTFKIISENGDVYYRSVRYQKSGDKFISSDIPTLNSLPYGTYTITEEPSLRFRYLKSETTDNDEFDKVSNGLKVTIDENNTSISVKFTNTIKSNDYETDSDIVVNSFTKDSNGNIHFGQDWLNGKTGPNHDNK